MNVNKGVRTGQVGVERVERQELKDGAGKGREDTEREGGFPFFLTFSFR